MRMKVVVTVEIYHDFTHTYPPGEWQIGIDAGLNMPVLGEMAWIENYVFGGQEGNLEKTTLDYVIIYEDQVTVNPKNWPWKMIISLQKELGESIKVLRYTEPVEVKE